MKLKHASVAALAAVSLLVSSCVYGPMDGYGTFSYSTNGYNSSVAWTSASYDANGFPIFGYSYGRPVYGYTEAGVAIFTVAALTALCFVPHWKPAPWYHGHWHYPAHIHRCAAPPHFPAGHRPGHRPSGGLNAPIHRNPGSVFKPHGNSHPGMNHGSNNRPGFGHQPNRPNMAPKPAPNHRPQAGNNHPGGKPQAKPNNGGMKPGMNNRPGRNRPNMGNRPTPNNRPGAAPNRPGNNGANMGRPSGNNRPQASRPSSGGRPSMGARPSGGSGRPGGGHGRR